MEQGVRQFVHRGVLYAEHPVWGLLRMGSWGWQPWPRDPRGEEGS